MSAFAILCPGQGTQTPELFSGFPFTDRGLALKEQAREFLEPEAADWLEVPSRNPQALFQNHLSQPLICLYQAMVWAELEPVLPRPALFAGYSLGELSAYGCAGALALGDLLRLATTRARLMDSAGPRGELIAVTGLPSRALIERSGVHLSIVICDAHWVVGCLAEQADRIVQELQAAGAKDVARLAVTVASHTSILDPAVEPFRAALQKVTWHALRSPVLAGVSASKVVRREQMEETLPEQIHRTIRWDHIQQRLQDSGCRVLLELGPGRQLARMAAREGLEARAIGEFRTPQGAAAWVKSALERSA